MTPPRWIKIDIEKLENPPLHLEAEDWCCFLREYTSGAGFSASIANNDISNFKKSSDRRGTQQWLWKEKAAHKFADELSSLFKERTWHVCAMPSSKTTDDPEYDPRFDIMLYHLKSLCPKLKIVSPIKKRFNTQPLHGGGRRIIENVYQSLEWLGFPSPIPETLIIIDDMITCGTTFKACKQLLRENCPQMLILGVFWTRCIWKEEAPFEDPT
jgi:hypothetical protein